MATDEKPKYQILKEYVIDTIRSEKLRPGEKIYSENELAEKFSISRHTVRQAIGELVSEGWLYRIQGKGTYVQNLKSKNSNSKTIGVITTYLNDYIFPSIIRGIDSVVSLSGYNIILSCTYNQHEKERLCLENLRNQNIAGLIVEPTKSALPNPNIDLYEAIKNDGIPVLFIHGTYPDSGVTYLSQSTEEAHDIRKSSFIVEDDVKAGYTATKHLLDLGHKKVGGIFKVDDMQGHLRFAGFQRAYFEQRLTICDSNVLWFGTDDMDDRINNDGFGKIYDIIKECTAVVCYNDIIALKVMDAARNKGLNVPDNISIVSFDDSQLAVASEVKLTSIAHPKEKLGEQAGTTIIELIERKKMYEKIKIIPELILRGSTKDINN